jgi:hypothetical protein
MLTIALALLLAQSAPPVVTTPGAAIDTSVRRSPLAFAPSRDAALIENSGSTNFAGFDIAIEPNGAALIREPGGVRRGTVSQATTKWFFSHLAKDRPLAKLAILHCMKPVSFASTITVTWMGQHTPDLGCGGSPATSDLNRTVGAIERELGVVPQPRGARYPQ